MEIGAIPVSLGTYDRQFFDLLCERYAGFLNPSPAEYALDIELTNGRLISDEDVCVRREGMQWVMERGDFQARWDPVTRHGKIRQGANPYAIDSVLRIVHSLILAERGGFLLHAASAVCDGRAFLFSGVSGAGKTTLSRLAPPAVTLLTDEISYVRPRPGGYSAYGTPFAGELARAGSNCSAPLEALFFLEKGPDNRAQELSSAEAVRRLMRNILFFAQDEELTGKLLATACDFVSQVPVFLLTFYPDGRVWELIRNLDGVAARG